MARGKKKESALTPEEKLAQALVPVEEQPYQVPGNWCWVKLSALSTLISKGTTPTGGKNAYVSEGVHFLRVENINDDGTISHDNIACVSEQMHTGFLKRSVLENRDVLVSIAGTLGKTGIVRDIDLPLNTNQAVAFVRLKTEDVNERYIKGVIDNPITQELLLGKTKVTSIPNLTLEIIGDCLIPLAPIAEQQRIVDRIEYLFARLDEAKEKAQSVLDSFETRKAAILHKAFTGELTAKWRKGNNYSSAELFHTIQSRLERLKRKRTKKVQNEYASILIGQIPEEWLLVDLDSISKLITDGEHSTPRRVDTFCGYYLLSARNIRNDSLLLDDVDYIDEAEYNVISNRCNPQKGDVLLSCSGSVGRCCVVSDDNKYCMVRSAAMLCPVECDPRFIMYMIQSDAVQDQIKKLSKQTAQANLFLGAIASLLIPLPSLEEQTEIVRILDSLLAKEQQAKGAAEAVLEKIDLLKKSILARAFRGELGTNDPSEESALELLKTIL